MESEKMLAESRVTELSLMLEKCKDQTALEAHSRQREVKREKEVPRSNLSNDTFKRSWLFNIKIEIFLNCVSILQYQDKLVSEAKLNKELMELNQRFLEVDTKVR